MPVKRILGQPDMYRDTTKPGPEQQMVEKMLSRLESKVSATIRRITADFEKQHRGLWLTRLERNDLRKFLFIMKYRGSVFHERYCHQTPADYEADDRERMLKYMEDRGFKRPVDVWLDNIKAVIDLEMDDRQEWTWELPKRMYPDDAKWAVFDMQSMYLAICTPSDPKDQFILTDNCYHVFEGPSNIRVDGVSGKSEGVGWVSFHEFAPISPKLLFVLRSFLVPSTHHAALPKAKTVRDACWAGVGKQFKEGTTSILADLPVEIAGNNYSELRDGLFQLIPGEDGSARQQHRFFFRFFPIGSDHVNKINGVFLGNAAECKSIVFRSPESFLRTLEWYMTVDPSTIGKRVINSPEDRKLSCLKKLATVMKHMGSGEKPVWDEIPLLDPDSPEGAQLMWDIIKKTLLPKLNQERPDDNPSKSMQIYQALGGSKKTFMEDVEQADLMLNLRDQLHAQSAGVNDELRRRNHDILIEAYLHFPPRRVFIYLQHLRAIDLASSASIPDVDVREALDPEDIVVKARSIIQTEKLATLMYIAAQNDIRRRRSPELNPWSAQRDFEHFMVFNHKIRDCGIKEIAIMAENEERRSRRSSLDRLERTFRDWAIEVSARVFARAGFKPIFGGRLEGDLLKDLEHVIFEIAYPTFPDTET